MILHFTAWHGKMLWNTSRLRLMERPACFFAYLMEMTEESVNGPTISQKWFDPH